MNAISRRFQNVRGPGERDPLAHLEIDPLRPLNNLLWGYIQDEQNRLTVKRRAYEYDHHYGLTLYGKAVPPLRPADSRSKFLEAFHNLLHRTLHLLQGGQRHDRDRRRLPAAQRAQGGAPAAGAGRAQPVRRPALDGARRDADPAVAPGAAGDARLPAEPGDGALQGGVDAAGRHHEDAAGLVGRHGHALPRSRRLRRADPAVDPLRRLDRRQRRELGEELGALLAAGDPGLPARLPGGHRRRPDQSGHRRLHTMPAVHLQKRLAMQRAR